jgi:hypothetical protein
MNKKLRKLKKNLARRRTPRDKFRFGALLGLGAGAIFCIIPYLSESAGEYMTTMIFGTFFISMGFGALWFWILTAVLIAGFSYLFGWEKVLGFAFGFFCTVLLVFFLTPLWDTRY